MHDGPAPQGGCYLRCYNGKVSDDRGTVGRGSPVPSCFKLHPGATLKIVLDPLARTATFFVGVGRRVLALRSANLTLTLTLSQP